MRDLERQREREGGRERQRMRESEIVKWIKTQFITQNIQINFNISHTKKHYIYNPKFFDLNRIELE